MKPQEKKVYKLLKHYFENNLQVKFRLVNNPQIEASGDISKLTWLFSSYVICGDMKCFLEDINSDTIMPQAMVISNPTINIVRSGITGKQRWMIFKRDNFVCQYCGRSGTETKLEVDHIKPISQGGTDAESNLITSCFECNRSKGGN